MVECVVNLDRIFYSLAHATRRDILRRVSKKELSIGTLAKPYGMSFAGVAKHVGILEEAGLVKKRRKGKEQRVMIVPQTVEAAQDHLKKYEELWQKRFAALEQLVTIKK